eukprot:CAMPEP_0202709340 /NCGR_PEP_ID=MMETSP1385-20130828/21472_1 /ASSEMBLY_ACC=CAM_ASM_000861 /TAXON_ID=933848 /ORGANISM="Elphidium margaritaceum" /LENGTH=458 /DNA_ID=CAMNT_0049368587 /DNA_START=55 /DNA_END=1428 /DNA_ORIENTATION=+
MPVHKQNSIEQEIRQKQETWENLTFFKYCNGRFDGNIIYLVMGALLVLFPWIVALYIDNAQTVTSVTLIFYSVVYTYMFTLAVLSVFTFALHVRKVMSFKDFDYCANGTVRNEQDEDSFIKHVVQILWYNEPWPVIEQTIAYVQLSKYMETSRKVIIVIAFEEKTSDMEHKKWLVSSKFRSAFADILYTVHPSGLSNHVVGTCSNVAWSTREVYKCLQQRDGDEFDDAAYLVTKLDTDTLIHPKYLASLEYNYLHACRLGVVGVHTIFVPLMCYEYALNECYWFVAAFAQWRTYYQHLLQFLGGWSAVASVYSLPLRLHFLGGFQCPFNVSEDSIVWLKYSIFTGRRLPVQVIPHYTVLGSTVGDTWAQALAAMGEQQRRWSMGEAQLTGILGKYTFSGHFSFEFIVFLFLIPITALVPALFSVSFGMLALASHFAHIVCWFGTQSLLHENILFLLVW